MKLQAITYLFISTFIFINAYSQYESVFGDSMSSWHILPINNCETISTYTLANTTDTIIDSVQYKCFKEFLPYYNSEIIIREAISSGRIYLYSPSQQKEYIVSDMTLKKGDNFFIYSNNFTDSTLIKVDSIYRIEGIKHIRFNKEITNKCDIRNDTTIWLEFIEGVGSNAGLIYNTGNKINSILLYHNKDARKVYSYFPGTNKQEALNIYNQDHSTSLIKVVQQNGSYKARIEFPFEHSAIAKFYLMDSKGNMLYEMNPINKKSIVFDFKEPGKYYFNVTFHKFEYCKIMAIE